MRTVSSNNLASIIMPNKFHIQNLFNGQYKPVYKATFTPNNPNESSKYLLIFQYIIMFHYMPQMA